MLCSNWAAALVVAALAAAVVVCVRVALLQILPIRSSSPRWAQPGRRSNVKRKTNPPSKKYVMVVASSECRRQRRRRLRQPIDSSRLTMRRIARPRPPVATRNKAYNNNYYCCCWNAKQGRVWNCQAASLASFVSTRYSASSTEFSPSRSTLSL